MHMVLRFEYRHSVILVLGSCYIDTGVEGGEFVGSGPSMMHEA